MTRDDLPEDELMTRLGAVLQTEADRYEPAAGSLARIRERAPTPSGRHLFRWLAPLAAAAVFVAVASALALFPGGDHTATPAPGASTPLPQPSADPTPTTSEPAPSEEPTPTVSRSSSSGPQQSQPTTNPPVACPNKGDHGYVYYVSDLNGLGPRLYRTTVVETCTLGIEDMLTVPSGRDDDFTTLWPAGTKVNSVTVAGSVATVDLSAFPATSPVEETAAVQQLVWTVTANDSSISAVRVKVHGAPPVAHLDWSKPVRRGNSLATLSNVWILTPGNGTPHSSPVTVHIYGTGFEGQVPLKIFQDGVEVASTAVVTRMGGFAEASTTFDLPPGSYEVRAYNDNGQNSDLTLWDTKTFTIS